MRLRPALRVALLALVAGCAEIAGVESVPVSEGGTADRSAADGPADRSAADVPVDRGAVDGQESDAGCSAPPGASGAACIADIGEVAGWKFVSYELGVKSCPAGYESPALVFSAGGPPTCACTCSGGIASCSSVNVLVGSGIVGCGGMTFSAKPTACTMPATPIPPGSRVAAAPVGVTSSACLPGPSSTSPPEPRGLVCTAKVGTGCGNGEVCLPVAVHARVCIEHAGDMPCPVMSLTQFVVASSFDDTRSCAPCTCAPSAPGSCEAQLNLFTDTSCSASALTEPADGVCRAVSNPASLQSVDFTLKPGGGGCIASPGMAAGTETPIGQQTLCCL